MRTIIINGKKLDNLVIGGSFELPFFSKETETISVPGGIGSKFLRHNHLENNFTIPLVYKNHYSKKENHQIMNEIVSFLDYDEPVTIQISGEDWFWIGYVNGPLSSKPFEETFQEFFINIALTDPTRYSLDTYKNTAVSDSVVVLNNGTAETPFEAEFLALKDASYLLITDVENSHFMIGEDSEDVVKKNYSPSLLTNEFRDKVGFSRMANTMTIDDRYLGGTLGASFGQTPETWFLDQKTISQTTGWRGGAYSRSFNRAAQNFKSTFKVNIHQRESGSGKIGQFIYDENGRLIFSVGYQNVHASKDSGRIVFMTYNEAGNEKMLWGPEIPSKLKKVPVLTIYFELIRQGQSIKMRYWFYDDTSKEGRHPHTVLMISPTRNFNDLGNFYQRKISSVRFGIFRGNGNHRKMTALGVYMYELLDKPPNASDMFIKQGDLIVLNTKEQTITINGTPYIHEKSFSSSYFKIPKGVTTLLIEPTETYDTTIKWRDRYK